MRHSPLNSPKLAASALAVAAMLTACGGGGSASAPAGSVDTTAPTVTITDSVDGATATGNVTFTFTFSEAVSGFTIDDITVTGGTKGTFTPVSSTSATLVVIPTSNSTGTIQVSVATNAFVDIATNANTASANSSQAYDTTVPTPTTTLVTFDETTAPTLTGFGGAEDSSVVADPTSSSNKVVKVVKSNTAELWAGTTISICPGDKVVRLPFTSSDKTMSARVYSPRANIPVRIKVEDASDNTRSVETEATVTQANTWQTLTFNFANPASGTAPLDLSYTYNKVSTFFDFGTAGNAGGGGSFYLDDLKFIGSSFSVSCPPAPTSFPLTFDNTNLEYTFASFGGNNASIATDPANSSNKVGKAIKSPTAELWAGTTISTGIDIPFTSSVKVMKLRVYSPVANIPVRLKVEHPTDTNVFVEADVTVTQANTWQTLTFNFASPVSTPLDLTKTYSKISVFFNFGTTGANGGGGTFYFDDLIFGN